MPWKISRNARPRPGVSVKAKTIMVLFSSFSQRSRYAHRGRLRARGSAAGRHYKRIIENELLPSFRAGDFNAGISRGVNAILQATRGEYRGSGRTNADAGRTGRRHLVPLSLFLLLLLMMVAANRNVARRGHSTATWATHRLDSTDRRRLDRRAWRGRFGRGRI